MMIRYETATPLPIDQVLAVYRALGWLSQHMPERVERAHAASDRIVSAWDGDRLVGWARIITDGEFCLFLHEILLLPEYQRKGIGSELMRRVLEGYEHVQNTVLLADPGNESFYAPFRFEVVTPAKGFSAMYRMGINWGRPPQ
ncbi:MAG: GNAT family N-acetyltransferase [Bacillota bacterium]